MLLIGALLIILQDVMVYGFLSRLSIPLAIGKLLDEAVIAWFVLVGVVVWWTKYCSGKTKAHKWVVLIISCIICVLICGFVGGVLNGADLVPMLLGAGYLIRPMIVFFIAYQIGLSNASSHVLLKVSIVFSIILLCAGALDFMFYEEWRRLIGIENSPLIQNWGHVSRSGQLRVMAIFEHPTLFGWMSSVVTLLGGAMMAARYRRGMAALLVFCGVLMILLSGSRKSLVAVVLTIFVFFFITNAVQRKTKVFLFIIFACVIALFAILFIDVILLNFHSLNKEYGTVENSSVARIALHLAAMEIGLLNMPFGEGFGRFGGNVSSVFYSPVYEKYGLSNIFGLSEDFKGFISDTYWPHILGELGFLGITIWLYILIKVLILLNDAVNALRLNNAPKATLVVAIWALVVYVEALIELLGAPLAEDPKGALVVWGLAGLVISLNPVLLRKRYVMS